MAGLIDCSFARVAVKQSFQETNGKPIMDKAVRLENYLRAFGEDYKVHFTVSQKLFAAKSKVLVRSFNLWKHKEEKQRYMNHFSAASWSKLAAYQKAAHTLSNCKACRIYHLPFHSLFPIRSRNLKNKNPLQEAGNIQQQMNFQDKLPKPTQAAIKEATRDIYSKINKPFKELYLVDFADALKKVPELKLQERKTHTEHKKIRRTQATQNKTLIEQNWSSVDVDTFLGTRQSYSRRISKDNLCSSSHTRMHATEQQNGNVLKNVEKESQRGIHQTTTSALSTRMNSSKK